MSAGLPPSALSDDRGQFYEIKSIRKIIAYNILAEESEFASISLMTISQIARYLFTTGVL